MTEQEIKKQIAHAKAVVSTWPVWKQNILVDSTVSSRQTARTPVIKTSAQVDSRKLVKPRVSVKKKSVKTETTDESFFGCFAMVIITATILFILASGLVQIMETLTA